LGGEVHIENYKIEDGYLIIPADDFENDVNALAYNTQTYCSTTQYAGIPRSEITNITVDYDDAGITKDGSNLKVDPSSVWNIEIKATYKYNGTEHTLAFSLNIGGAHFTILGTSSAKKLTLFADNDTGSLTLNTWDNDDTSLTLNAWD
jgi:predicted aspartyl protease